MKILLIRTASGTIDIEKNSFYNHQETGLAKALNRKGHQCDVVYNGGKRNRIIPVGYDEKGNCFNVIYLKGYNFLKSSIFFGLYKLVKQYDIIHSGEYDTISSWILAKKFPEKLIIFHGTYYSPFNKRYNKKCKVVDQLFLPTYIKKNIWFDTKSRLAEGFLKEKGIKKVKTIGVGLDLDMVDTPELIQSELSTKLSEIRKRGAKLLLYIGRIEPRRNIKFLLDVVKSVSEKENIRLVLVGKGGKAYTDSCFEYARQLGISDLILRESRLSQKYLKAIYKSCDVFLLPTIYEIFGMVLLEAMYYGLPVISSPNGGSDLLIKNGENGFIVQNNELEQWERIVTRILSDSTLAKEIGDKATKTIRNGYIWDMLADSFLELFQEKHSEKKLV